MNPTPGAKGFTAVNPLVGGKGFTGGSLLPSDKGFTVHFAGLSEPCPWSFAVIDWAIPDSITRLDWATELSQVYGSMAVAGYEAPQSDPSFSDDGIANAADHLLAHSEGLGLLSFTWIAVRARSEVCKLFTDAKEIHLLFIRETVSAVHVLAPLSKLSQLGFLGWILLRSLA